MLKTMPTVNLRPGPARLGEWLVLRGLIDRAELFLALDVAFRYSCRLGDALVWLEVLDRGVIEREVARMRYHAPR